MDVHMSSIRKRYHEKLLGSILSIDKNGVPSNADKSSPLSVNIASGITDTMKSSVKEKAVAQTSGKKFEVINMEFLTESFPMLQHIRQGKWKITRLGNRNRIGISDFEQYAHLQSLNDLSKQNSILAAALGNDYTVTPDVIVFRELLTDEEINETELLVDSSICLGASIRLKNGGKPLLHASVSSKWTIRSDRSQNSRTEALNLIRNRKGHLPHIVVVTGEPLPSRIASIALGTGDIDCVYHFALYELISAVNAVGGEDSKEMLNIMLEGKRLKDISDLPLDLCV